MKAVRYEKVDELPKNAVKVSTYAANIGQRNPPYICLVYNRYLDGKGSKPPYKIVNWQGYNFVIPE